MGWASESSTEEEGVTLQKATQANGRKSLERCNITMSLSIVWTNQEDAHSLPDLLGS